MVGENYSDAVEFLKNFYSSVCDEFDRHLSEMKKLFE
jgi:hypothetical protein